jgi:hypothetical protein
VAVTRKSDVGVGFTVKWPQARNPFGLTSLAVYAVLRTCTARSATLAKLREPGGSWLSPLFLLSQEYFQ